MLQSAQSFRTLSNLHQTVFLPNIKEIERLCGGDLVVAAQANVQIDAEIGQKDHFRMETNQHHKNV